MTNASLELIQKFSLGDASPPRFFRSLEEIEKWEGKPIPYTHLMRRAWNTMGLNAILCVDGRPTVYFKEMNAIDYEQIRVLHWQFWNQGTATLLVISTPREVQVYSGFIPPAHSEKDLKSDNRLVAILKDTIDLLQFVQRVETGELYNENIDSFNTDDIIDKHLLSNLKSTRDQLSQCSANVSLKTIHAILGRVVFTCYLTARKIITERQFIEIGAEGVDDLGQLLIKYVDNSQAKDLLYKLFKQLSIHFNGSMFDNDLDSEMKRINSKHIEVLRRFLNVEDMASGQINFSFWQYNFEIIPVETISAIYEQFIEAESPQGRRKSGAFYTPRHLAEIIVDVATEGWSSLLDKRFLDPAVGSGIFLVILFNRIAEEWRKRNPDQSNHRLAKALRQLLVNNLCGIDTEETACRIACFSLYLAYLDQLEPRDIEHFKMAGEKVLPSLLSLKKDGYQSATSVIYQGNFFDGQIPIPHDFDLVIGNPPWTGRNDLTDRTALDWCMGKDNPYRVQSTKSLKLLQDIFIPNDQLAHAFMWKAPVHIRSNGKAALLLPSKVFLNNNTNLFQEHWVKRYSIDKVVQLSDLSLILFDHAKSPASVVVFQPTPPTSAKKYIDYIVPKASLNDPRKGLIEILPDDLKTLKIIDIEQAAARGEAPIIWKKSIWGSTRDLRLIDRLLELPRLNALIQNGRWIKGQGFQPDTKNKCKNPKKPWWTQNSLYLNTKTVDLEYFLSPDSCIKIGNSFPSLYFTRSPDIFKAPMVLINQGFTKSTFVDFDVLFRHSLQSICGPTEDRKYLKFLAAVLNSKLAKYFLFHTSSNWGTERNKVQLFELLRMPFFLPSDSENPPRAIEIIKTITTRFDFHRRQNEINPLDRDNVINSLTVQIEPFIYEYYGINQKERLMIEDTVNIIAPSCRPSINEIHEIPILKKTNMEDRKKYSIVLCQTLNNWAKRSGIVLSGNSVISESIGIGILTLNKSKRTVDYEESSANTTFINLLKQIKSVLPNYNGKIKYSRGMTIFTENDIHIIKPLAIRHWMRTSALNDADEIASAILSTIKKVK